MKALSNQFILKINLKTGMSILLGVNNELPIYLSILQVKKYKKSVNSGLSFK